MELATRSTHASLAMVLIAVFCAAGQAGAWSSGPPDGYCGNPPDMVTCEACHVSFPGDGSLSLTGLPAGGYVLGNTYPLTVTLADNGQRRWGFELTALETAAFTQAGTFVVTDPVNTQLSNHPEPNPDFLKHTSTGTHNGTLNGPVNWSFNWTAPMSGERVTFYVAGNAADGSGSPSGDFIYLFQPTVDPATTGIATGASPAIALIQSSFPNPAPAGSLASLRFSLARPSHVVLRVIDANGRFVAEPFSADLGPGLHLATWNGLSMVGEAVPRGVYFLTLRTPSQDLVSRRIVN